MQTVQCAIALPEAEVAVNRAPMGIGGGQLPPGTTGCEQVKHGVEGLAQANRAWASTRLGCEQQILDMLPLVICQISRISCCGHAFNLLNFWQMAHFSN